MDSLKYPNQFEFEGIIYGYPVSRESLARIRGGITLNKEDVIISTYPKSGTTWMSEIVHCLDVGPEQSRKRKTCMDDIMPYLEFDTGPGQRPMLDTILATPSPRRIRSHLNARFFEGFLREPTNCPKFIIVARNPKDTLVSYYHFHRLLPLGLEDISFDDFFSYYQKRAFMYGDVIDYNLAWWKYRNHSNVLFVHYEDLLEDGVGMVRKVAEFLGRHLSEEQLKGVVASSSFEEMKQRGPGAYFRLADKMDEVTSNFFRKGIKGDWKNNFTAEQSNFIQEQLASKSDPQGLHYHF